MPDSSFQPDWFSKPGDTLLTLMEQQELTSEALAKKLGCERSVVQGLLSGAVPVDDKLAGGLSKCVGGTPSFWRARQTKYLEALARAANAVPRERGLEWINQFPHKDIANYGWVTPPAKRDELIKACVPLAVKAKPGGQKRRPGCRTDQGRLRPAPPCVFGL